jgi:hypothetical protein
VLPVFAAEHSHDQLMNRRIVINDEQGSYSRGLPCLGGLETLPAIGRVSAAAASVLVTIEGTADRFAGEDRDFLDRFFVPGIQRASGLEAARSAESDSATSGSIRASGTNVLGSVLPVRLGHYRITHLTYPNGRLFGM